MIALVVLVVPGIVAVASGIDANRRDGDWAFPWQGSLTLLGGGQLALAVAILATSANPALVLLFGLATVLCTGLPVVYWMQADNHPRGRKPYQPDRFPTGRG